MAAYTPIRKTETVVKALVLSESDGSAFQSACRNLSEYGYVLSSAHRDQDLTEVIAKNSPDIILLDSLGPELIVETAGEIRERADIPVIAVLKADTVNKVTDHLSAVDDFVVIPFEVKELDLRSRRLLRKQKVDDERLDCGDLVIDLATCEVTISGNIVPLTFKEYELLKFLVSNQGRVFSRDVLLDKVWGYDYYGGDRTVDVHVRRLRSKIEDANHSFIETVRNIGYRFHTEP
jgi:two-component system, OmpR family, alkaline phosphatase synthesis response regulator PhoP